MTYIANRHENRVHVSTIAVILKALTREQQLTGMRHAIVVSRRSQRGGSVLAGP